MDVAKLYFMKIGGSMITSQLKVAGLMMVLLMVGVVGHVRAEVVWSCSDVVARQYSNTMLKRMFQVASLEEWAFNENEETQGCESEDGTVLADPPIVIHEEDVLSNIAKVKTFPYLFGCTESALLSSDDGEGGERFHISCHGTTPDVELAIRLHLMRASVYYYDQGDGEIQKHIPHVSVEVDVVVPESLLDHINHQEIEVSEATFVDSNNPFGHEEKVFLIRGTDLDRYHFSQQLNASIQGAMGNPCAFSAASMLVRRIHLSYKERNGYGLSTIAGHSLGGTATQHISTDQQSRPAYYLSEFEAYSFNGLGVPEELSKLNDQNESLYSYTVKGDWIDALRKVLGQTEVGIQWKYEPGNISWGPWGTGRHSMESVRKSLCRCINGKGKLKIS